MVGRLISLKVTVFTSVEIAIRSTIVIRKVGFRLKIFDRDTTFSDFGPERIAIGGRIENRIETISNSSFYLITDFDSLK